MVDVSHIFIAIAVEAVIVTVTAKIVTEFFVRTAMQSPLATDALFGKRNHGKQICGEQTATKINRQTKNNKRIYTWSEVFLNPVQ